MTDDGIIKVQLTGGDAFDDEHTIVVASSTARIAAGREAGPSAAHVAGVWRRWQPPGRREGGNAQLRCCS